MDGVLLDTHAFLWWLDGDRKLSLRARKTIQTSTEVFVSAATAWEICTKARLGKLPGAEAVAQDVLACVVDQSFLPLDITVRHAEAAGRLAGEHRDPFDRMLVVQALAEGLALVSNDRALDTFGVRRLW